MTEYQKVICVIYLLLIAGAEVSIIYTSAFGIAFHVAILFSLLISSVLTKNSTFADFLLAFTIVPLIRILSLSMPLTHLAYIMWFLLISIPIFIAIFACMMLQKLSLKNVGITFPKAKDLPIEIGVVLLALPTGVLEYYLLKPEPLLYELEPALLIASVLIIIICTGFVEELTFRGLLLKKHKFDVIHYPAGMPFFPWMTDSKNITTLHSVDSLILPRYYPKTSKLTWLARKPDYKRLDSIITVSEAEKNEIARTLRIPEEK